MRPSNAIGRVNQELKRRTRVAALFPNEASLLRLISALLCEQNDEWLTKIAMDSWVTTCLLMSPAQNLK